MTDTDRLLQTFIERFESGGAVDPTDLLEQVEGRDRARLSVLIEGYLEHAAPTQDWDPKAFEGSVAQRATERVREAWAAEDQPLPKLLVERRKRAKLQRAKLVERLAEALGVPDKQQKVARYYNGLEHGWLDPRGVSDKVFDGLASLLDTSSEALRKAGEAVTPSAGGEPAPLYMRMTPAPGQVPEGAIDADEMELTPLEVTGDWDEVDRLFRAGDKREGK